MAYTVNAVRERFPDVQFVGGSGVVMIDNKHVDLGRVAADGEFVPSVKGKELLQSVDTSAEVEAPKVTKPKTTAKKPKAPATEPEVVVEQPAADGKGEDIDFE